MNYLILSRSVLTIASAAIVVWAIDIIRRMTAATWHPYRFAIISLCVGAFGSGTVRLWPADSPGAGVAGDLSVVLLLFGLAGLILCERRRRAAWSPHE